MIAFYAMGGGLGHLTRVRAFIHTYNIEEPFKVITANHAAFRFFANEQVLFIESDKETTGAELARKIHDATHDLAFIDLYIDAFPCGILGELSEKVIPAEHLHYLARRLVWKNYQPLLSNEMTFNDIYRFEPLESDHQMFIQNHGKQIIDCSLDFSFLRSNKTPSIKKPLQPLWLIVHSTHPEELELLLHHAQDIAQLEQVSPYFVVLSDVSIPLPDSIELLMNEQPMNWYPLAERVFTGVGFNTWYQLQACRNKHTALPFKRKFDDQFWRVGLKDDS
ncbi:MAG: hypothetical protein AAF519_16665 [Bacteroidota bacterium]